MLYKKFRLVPETNWDRVAFLHRNRHTQIIYAVEMKTIFADPTDKVLKILMSHGSSDGSIHREVDLPSILYDVFDRVFCCYPNQVAEYFQGKYGKAIPVFFPSFKNVLWSKFSKTSEGIILEISDMQNMTEQYQDEVLFSEM